MSENLIDQFQKNAVILKSRVPFLRTETHYNPKNILFYDRIDFDKIAYEQDWQSYVSKKQASSPKINYLFVKQHVYVKVLGEPEFLEEKLFCVSSTIWINLISWGVLVNPYKIPLLNTALLVTSGVILTLAHIYLRLEKYLAAFRSLLLTILFGLFFIYVQGYEYWWSCFAINDGAYGSVFYMLTGFHGFHVIIGTAFLVVCAFRLKAGHFTHRNHFAFEAAIWY